MLFATTPGDASCPIVAWDGFYGDEIDCNSNICNVLFYWNHFKRRFLAKSVVVFLAVMYIHYTRCHSWGSQLFTCRANEIKQDNHGHLSVKPFQAWRITLCACRRDATLFLIHNFLRLTSERFNRSKYNPTKDTYNNNKTTPQIYLCSINWSLLGS